jgi:NADH-quinone oxidoreductase subunit G
VKVYPTGVFTDKALKKHYTRKWDLQTAPSICVHCGLGCNTIPGERYGTLRRIRARFNRQVNGYFLCDRGRYGYEFVNSDRRIRQPLLRGADGQLRPVGAAEAIRRAGEMLAGGRPLGVGSGRASLESNFALLHLVGQDRFLHGMAEGHHRLVRLILDILRKGPVPAASLQEADGSDAVFILGEDVTNTAPMLALALRQAVLEMPMMDAARRQSVPDWVDAVLREAIQQEKGPFFVATPDATKLDDLATATYRAAPADLARLGLAVAHAVDAHAPAVTGLPADLEALAGRIAQSLARGDRPLVVAGITCGSEALLRAAANVAWAMRKTHPKTKLCFTVPECNSLGLALPAWETLQPAGAGEAGTRIS